MKNMKDYTYSTARELRFISMLPQELRLKYCKTTLNLISSGKRRWDNGVDERVIALRCALELEDA